MQYNRINRIYARLAMRCCVGYIDGRDVRCSACCATEILEESAQCEAATEHSEWRFQGDYRHPARPAARLLLPVTARGSNSVVLVVWAWLLSDVWRHGIKCAGKGRRCHSLRLQRHI